MSLKKLKMTLSGKWDSVEGRGGTTKLFQPCTYITLSN